MALILTAAAVVSLAIGSVRDAVSILAILSLPALQPFFKTVSLNKGTLGWVIVPGITVFIVLELVKYAGMLMTLRDGERFTA